MYSRCDGTDDDDMIMMTMMMMMMMIIIIITIIQKSPTVPRHTVTEYYCKTTSCLSLEIALS